VAEVDTSFWTPLHNAALHGNIGIIVELIKLDCEIDAETRHGQVSTHVYLYKYMYEHMYLFFCVYVCFIFVYILHGNIGIIV
jgi:ankyrin repeat protein